MTPPSRAVYIPPIEGSTKGHFETSSGILRIMTTVTLAIVCALGIAMPILLGLLPSQRRRRAARR